MLLGHWKGLSQERQLLKHKGRDTVLHNENLETKEGQGEDNKEISCGSASCDCLSQNSGPRLFHIIFYKKSTPLYAVQISSFQCNVIQCNRIRCIKDELSNCYMSTAILVTVMIIKKDCTKQLHSQGDCEHNPVTEIATQYSTKIIGQNKRTGLQVSSGFYFQISNLVIGPFNLFPLTFFFFSKMKYYNGLMVLKFTVFNIPFYNK